MDSFYSKVVGVTFKNEDGESRQAIIKKCYVGQKLNLIPEPTQKYPNAVKVVLTNGKQIGYLDERLGREISRFISEDGKVKAEISSLTGGTKDKKTMGCNIKITKIDSLVKHTKIQDVIPGPKKIQSNNTGCSTLLLMGICIPLIALIYLFF